MSKNLSDKKYIFTLLTALVKKSGGELRLSADELAEVTSKDVVSLLYDTKTSEIVLRTQDYTSLGDLASLLSPKKKDKDYEN